MDSYRGRGAVEGLTTRDYKEGLGGKGVQRSQEPRSPASPTMRSQGCFLLALSCEKQSLSPEAVPGGLHGVAAGVEQQLRSPRSKVSHVPQGREVTGTFVKVPYLSPSCHSSWEPPCLLSFPHSFLFQPQLLLLYLLMLSITTQHPFTTAGDRTGRRSGMCPVLYQGPRLQEQHQQQCQALQSGDATKMSSLKCLCRSHLLPRPAK